MTKDNLCKREDIITDCRPRKQLTPSCMLQAYKNRMQHKQDPRELRNLKKASDIAKSQCIQTKEDSMSFENCC